MASMTPKELHLILRYDAKTGKLFWKRRPLSTFATKEAGRTWNVRFAGKEAFTYVNARGYREGTIYGENCKAHRVIWAMQMGNWPEGQIDHEDGNSANNKWGNLREANPSQNTMNRGKFKGSSSAYKGVCWLERARKWRASIRPGANQKSEYLGLFTDEMEAAKAYDAAAKIHHGEFARLNFENTC